MFDNIAETPTVMTLNSKGEPLAPKNNKTAIIDADTMIVQVCVTTQQQIGILPREFYTPEQWEEIVKHPTYSLGAEFLYEIDLELALTKFDSKLQDILDNTGCSKYELHFTRGRENFRYLLYPKYKANRKDAAPIYGIDELKDLVTERYADKAERILNNRYVEADDTVVARVKADLHSTILVAVDKDVLYSVPGRHWNYYQSPKYSIDPTWVEVDKITAMKHPYIQTLTGDPTDGIKTGLSRVGPKTAEKILKNATTNEEMEEAVLNTYIKQGFDKYYMQLIKSLVDMSIVQYGQGGQYYFKKDFIKYWADSYNVPFKANFYYIPIEEGYNILKRIVNERNDN